MIIDIKGLDKAAVLAALYNAATPLGKGWFQFNLSPMSIEEARKFLEEYDDAYFDYVGGRVLKVDLSKDEFDSQLYDTDNGKGAAEKALKTAGLL